MKVSLLSFLTLVVPFVAEGNEFVDALEAIRAKYRLPAITSVAASEGKVVHGAWVGHRKHGDPTFISGEDRWLIGSNLKAVVATMVQRSIDAGTISWSTSLSEAFPGLAMHPDFRNVPLSYLSSHRAGFFRDLSDYGDQAFYAQVAATDHYSARALLAARVLSRPPKHTPGSRFLYSNVGYVILAHILEKKLNRTFDSLIRSEIFQPLGMDSCRLGDPAHPLSNPPNQPWGHRYVDGRLEPIMPASDRYLFLGPSGLYSCSMGDWAKFADVHLKGFNGNPTSFAQPQFFTILHRIAFPEQNENYTFGGWGRVDRNWSRGATFTHSGSYQGMKSVIWASPGRNYSLMAVANAVGPDVDAALDEAVSLVLKYVP